jgi:hypothetical protein
MSTDTYQHTFNWYVQASTSFPAPSEGRAVELEVDHFPMLFI